MGGPSLSAAGHPQFRTGGRGGLSALGTRAQVSWGMGPAPPGVKHWSLSGQVEGSPGIPQTLPPALRFLPPGAFPSLSVSPSPSLPHPPASQPESQSLGEEAGAPLWFHTPLRVWPLQSSCDSCHTQHRLPRGTLLRQSWGTQPLPQPRTGRRAGRWRNMRVAGDVYELGDPRAHAPSPAQSARVRFSGTLLALEGMAGSVPAGP